MSRPRPGIGTEILPVALILGCLLGSWLLIVSVHRRAAITRSTKPEAKAVAKTTPRVAPPLPVPVAPPPAPVVAEAEPEPAPEPIPAPKEDPSKVEIARLAVEESQEILATRDADRRAAALEKAIAAAKAETERWKRREQAIRSQIDSLTQQTRELDQEADQLAAERDVLARERDISKAELSKAKTRSSFAVLPHRGPNGTWRRPIIIECTNGTATIRPNGPTFRMIDLSGSMGMRSSPLVVALVRELMRAQGKSAPDGSPAIPYIFFVVRPDGIRPYYESRARLEPLGIAFGYELVPQDMEIEFPDLDNPSEWDGSAPIRPLPESVAAELEARPNPSSPNRSSSAPRRGKDAGGGAGTDHPEDEFRWPAHSQARGDNGGFGDNSGRLPGKGIRDRLAGSDTGGDSEDDSLNGYGGRSLTNRGSGSISRGTGRELALGSGMPGSPGGIPGMLPAIRGSGSSDAMGGFPRAGTANDLGLTPPGARDSDLVLPLSPPGTGSSSGGGSGNGLTVIPPTGGDSEIVPPLSPPANAPGEIIEAAPNGGGPETPGTSPWSGSAKAPSGSGQPPAPMHPDALPELGEVDPANTPFGGNRAGSPSGSRSGGATSGSGTGSGRAGNGQSAGSLVAGSGATPPAGSAGGTPPNSGGSGPVATAPNTGGLSVPLSLGTPTNPGGTPGMPTPLVGLTNQGGDSSSPASTNSNGSPPRQRISEKSLEEAETDELLGPQGNGQDGGSQNADKNQDGKPLPRRKRDDIEHKTIHVPMEIVVACEADGIVIHPGGYRLTNKALRAKEPVVVKTLQGVVKTRQQVDPLIKPIPSVRYLVERGGEENYRVVRRQTVLSGLEWPSVLQISDMRLFDLMPRGTF